MGPFEVPARGAPKVTEQNTARGRPEDDGGVGGGVACIPTGLEKRRLEFALTCFTVKGSVTLTHLHILCPLTILWTSKQTHDDRRAPLSPTVGSRDRTCRPLDPRDRPSEDAAHETQTVTPGRGLGGGAQTWTSSSRVTALTATPCLIPLCLCSFFHVFGMTSLWTGLMCWIRKAAYRRPWVDLGLGGVTSSGWTAAAPASD